MQLDDIINVFKTVALSYKSPRLSFDMGDDYLIEGSQEHQYPKFFLETPFQIFWNSKSQQQYYSVGFAFYVLMNKAEDDTEDQIAGVSDSALITERILTKIRTDFHQILSIDSVDSLTFNDMTNEGLSTCRTNITVLVLRNVCDNEDEYFDE